MRDLADRAGVAWTTTARIEVGQVSARLDTAAKIPATFERHGVEIIFTAERTGAVLRRRC